MKDLLLYIAQNLVEHPEQVSVTEVENGDELTLQLRAGGHGQGHRTSGPYRQGDTHCDPFLRPAHRRQGVCGYR